MFPFGGGVTVNVRYGMHGGKKKLTIINKTIRLEGSAHIVVNVVV